MRWLAVAVVAGLATGALTLAGQAVLPTEANRLANSGAIWVSVAFAVGWRAPSDAMAALAGLMALVAALVGYFVTAAIAQAGVSASTVAIWVAVALIGGPVFGIAGRWRATAPGWRAAIAVAALGAVYLSEGLWTLWGIPHMALAGWASVVVGCLITLLLASDRDTRTRACLLLVPLTALGLAGYGAIDLVFRSV
ncbi:MAG: DUF6518 family protein [Candidatus Limnocylindrales bacterium]